MKKRTWPQKATKSKKVRMNIQTTDAKLYNHLLRERERFQNPEIEPKALVDWEPHDLNLAVYGTQSSPNMVAGPAKEGRVTRDLYEIRSLVKTLKLTIAGFDNALRLKIDSNHVVDDGKEGIPKPGLGNVLMDVANDSVEDIKDLIQFIEALNQLQQEAL